MEVFLYPGNDVQPVEVGDGYRDYWLNDVVKSYGAFVRFVKVGCAWDCSRASGEIQLARLVESGREMLWHGEIVSPEGMVIHTEAKKFVEDEHACNWTDLKVRYSIAPDGSLSFPACLAARHIRDYVDLGKHIDALVDFATGEHYWRTTEI